MSLMLLFAISAISGLISTWISRQVAWRFGIVNKPNPLVPQHDKPVAYLGGAGIFLGLLFGLLIHIYIDGAQVPVEFWAGASGFVLLGLVDDLVEFKPVQKFALQIALTAVLVWSGVHFAFFGVAFLDATLSGLWILILVNAFNLTDVCDGLVGGLSILVFLFIALMYDFPLAIVCAGAATGFLLFNFPPASIFLGDAGSHLLGFVCAYLSLSAVPASSTLTEFLNVALLTSVMCFELIFLVVVRYRKGLKWWQGSRDHFSLRLQASGMTKLQTDLVGWGLGVVCGLPLVLASRFDVGGWLHAFSVFGVVVVFALFWRYLLRLEQGAHGQ